MREAPNNTQDEFGTVDSSTRQSEVKEESEVFDTFATIVRNKISDASNIERLDALYKSPDYKKEKEVLTDINNNGMAWALGAGLGTFILLRKAPIALARYAVSRRGASTGGTGNGYKFDTISSRSPFERSASDQPRKPGLFFRAVKLGLDLFVSGSIAVYSSVLFADKKKLLRDVSDVPLVEGRSLIADEFCTAFMAEYKTIPQETWSKYRGTSDVTDAIENFVLNCKRREAFEAQLRTERGLKPGGSGEHLPLPSPGVPRTLDVSVHDISSQPSRYGENFTDASEMEDGEEGDVITDWHSIDDFEREGETEK